MNTSTSTASSTSPLASVQVANCFVTVDDPETALVFYRDVLGFTVHTDVSNGDFRWLTLTTPQQPELEITIQPVGGGMPMPDADRALIADLLAKGLLSGLNFECADVDALFEQVLASGAEVMQEPADQFYGVRDCAFRDPAGNMLRFNTPLPAPGSPSGSESGSGSSFDSASASGSQSDSGSSSGSGSASGSEG